MDKLVETVRSFFTEFVISVDDLRNPTPVFVRDFFVRVLIELQVDVENVRKVQIHQQNIDELDILPELNLVTAIRSSVPCISIGLFDLLNPKSKNIVPMMGRVMNFLQFADSRMCKLNTDSEELIRERTILEDLQREKEENMKRLNRIILEKDSHLECKLELESKLKEKKIEDQKLCEEFSSFNRAGEDLSREYKRKEELLLALNKKVSHLSRELEGLKAEIVDNPKILQEEFDSIEQEKNKLEQEKNELSKHVLEKQQTKATLQTFLEKFNETLQKSRPILMQMIKKTCDANDEIQDIIRDTNEMEREKEVYVDKCQEAQLKIESLQNQMKTMDLSHKENVMELEKKIAEEESAYQKLLDKKMEVEKDLVHSKNEIKKLDDLIASYHQECDTLMANFYEIESYYTDYEGRDAALLEIMDKIELNLKLPGRQGAKTH